jgi:site-specific DNA recombinase
MENQLRFAILARVSSQVQDDEGYSLETQIEDLTNDIVRLNGIVAKVYQGVESAYIEERPILHELLLDCSLNIFDAVIVNDLSRLSRLMDMSLFIYKEFKKYRIKLFIRSQEFDPNSHDDKLMFNVMTAMNEYQSSVTKAKSLSVKKSRAALGYPSSGELPFGRICTNIKSNDRVPVWEIIPKKKQLADRIFQYYVNENKNYYEISKLVGLHQHTIRSILGKFAGNNWDITLDGIKFKIQVPELFTPEEILSIEQARKNHIAFHGQYTHRRSHLLASFVKCSYCGRKMGSTSNQRGNRYYTHYFSPTYKPTEQCIINVPAYYLENIVISQIGELIASQDRLKEAIENVTNKIQNNETALHNEIACLDIRINDENKAMSRILSLVRSDTITIEDATKELSKIKSTLNLLNSEKEQKSKQLDLIGTTFPKKFDKSVSEFFDLICRKEGRNIETWDKELQRQILKVFFGDAHGKNIGIFVKKIAMKHFAYDIKGVIINGHGDFHSNPFDSFLISELGTWVNNANMNSGLDLASLRKVVEVITQWIRNVKLNHFLLYGEFRAKGVPAGRLKAV